MIDKLYVKESFSKAAKCYEEVAIFQKELADQIIAHIQDEQLVGHILDIGGGTGYLSSTISSRNKEIHVCSLDISHAMSIMAHSKKVSCPNISVVTSDGEALPFRDSSFDMVISNLAFQWVSYLKVAFSEILRVLNKGSRFYITIVAKGSLAELRESYRYAFGNNANKVMMDMYPSEKTISAILKEVDVTYYQIEDSRRVRYHKNSLAFLKSLKSIGAGNPFPHRRNVGATKKMLDYYNQNFNTKGGITSTYQILFIEGIK